MSDNLGTAPNVIYKLFYVNSIFFGLGITGELLLRDYSKGTGKTYSANQIHLKEDSPFVVVLDKNGGEIVVRKSSICWLLSKDKFKLSSDRLQRVQEKEYDGNISGIAYYVSNIFTFYLRIYVYTFLP